MSAFDACVIGEILIDLLPTSRGPLHTMRGFEVHNGGAPANVAAGICRFGGTAAMISRLGQDDFGQLAVDRLTEHGVDCNRVEMMPGEQTALCFITLDQHGERSFTHRGGDPFGALSAGDLDRGLVSKAKSIVFSCGALRSTRSYEAVKKAINWSTGLICCDPGGFPRSWGDKDEIHGRIVDVARRCHVFKCSRDEGEIYFGEHDPQKAVHRILEQGAQLAVVTDGADGAYYATQTITGHVPAPKVKVVDTTGAGDAFMAGLVYGLTRPLSSWVPDPVPLSEHIRFACNAGAHAVTELGAVAGPQQKKQAPSC